MPRNLTIDAVRSGPRRIESVKWLIISGEYPPQPGGISDYTKMVADGLRAAGDQVEVCTPSAGRRSDEADEIRIVELSGRFGPRAIRELNACVTKMGMDVHLLIQYEPHAFGWRALNVPFCVWLRSLRRYPISVIFHEIAYPFARNQPVAHNALAAVNRVMALIVARAASRIFMTTPAWHRQLRRFGRSATRIEWIPVPSTIPVYDCKADDRESIRLQYGLDQSRIIGHFGTYGVLTRSRLSECIDTLVAGRADRSVLLLGRNSREFRDQLVADRPALAPRLHAAGNLEARDVSRHLAACDLMLQPYPDGITTRRTSVMSALAHGVPVASNLGDLSERFWSASDSVALANDYTTPSLVATVERLLCEETERCRVGRAGYRLYSDRFDIRHTIDSLRSAQ